MYWVPGLRFGWFGDEGLMFRVWWVGVFWVRDLSGLVGV